MEARSNSPKPGGGSGGRRTPRPRQERAPRSASRSRERPKTDRDEDRGERGGGASDHDTADVEIEVRLPRGKVKQLLEQLTARDSALKTSFPLAYAAELQVNGHLLPAGTVGVGTANFDPVEKLGRLRQLQARYAELTERRQQAEAQKQALDAGPAAGGAAKKFSLPPPPQRFAEVPAVFPPPEGLPFPYAGVPGVLSPRARPPPEPPPDLVAEDLAELARGDHEGDDAEAKRLPEPDLLLRKDGMDMALQSLQTHGARMRSQLRKQTRQMDHNENIRESMTMTSQERAEYLDMARIIKEQQEVVDEVAMDNTIEHERHYWLQRQIRLRHQKSVYQGRHDGTWLDEYEDDDDDQPPAHWRPPPRGGEDGEGFSPEHHGAQGLNQNLVKDRDRSMSYNRILDGGTTDEDEADSAKSIDRLPVRVYFAGSVDGAQVGVRPQAQQAPAAGDFMFVGPQDKPPKDEGDQDGKPQKDEGDKDGAGADDPAAEGDWWARIFAGGDGQAADDQAAGDGPADDRRDASSPGGGSAATPTKPPQDDPFFLNFFRRSRAEERTGDEQTGDEQTAEGSVAGGDTEPRGQSQQQQPQDDPPFWGLFGGGDDQKDDEKSGDGDDSKKGDQEDPPFWGLFGGGENKDGESKDGESKEGEEEDPGEGRGEEQDEDDGFGAGKTLPMITTETQRKSLEPGWRTGARFMAGACLVQNPPLIPPDLERFRFNPGADKFAQAQTFLAETAGKVMGARNQGRLGHQESAQFALDFVFAAAKFAEPACRRKSEAGRYVAVVVDVLNFFPRCVHIHLWGVEALIALFRAAGWEMSENLGGPIFDTATDLLVIHEDEPFLHEQMPEFMRRLLAAFALVMTPALAVRVLDRHIDFALRVVHGTGVGPVVWEHGLQVMLVSRSPHKLREQAQVALWILRHLRPDPKLVIRAVLALSMTYSVRASLRNSPSSSAVLGIQEITAAMDLYSDNRKVQGAGANALAAVLKVPGVDLQALSDEGAIRTVIAAQQHFPSSRAVAWSLCRMVAHISRAKQDMLNVLIIKNLLKAGLEFVRDTEVAVEAIEAVHALLVPRTGSQVDRYRELCEGNDSSPLLARIADGLVTIGESHHAHRGTMELMLEIFIAAASDSRAGLPGGAVGLRWRVALTNAAAVVVPARVLFEHHTREKLVHKAAHTIRCLTFRSIDACKQLGHLGVVSALLSALRAHCRKAAASPQEAPTKAAADFFATPVEIDQAAQRVADSSLISDFARELLAALANVVTDEKSCLEFVQGMPGSSEAVYDAMEMYGDDDPDVFAQGCRIFGTVASYMEATKSSAKRKGKATDEVTKDQVPDWTRLDTAAEAASKAIAKRGGLRTEGLFTSGEVNILHQKMKDLSKKIIVGNLANGTRFGRVVDMKGEVEPHSVTPGTPLNWRKDPRIMPQFLLRSCSKSSTSSISGTPKPPARPPPQPPVRPPWSEPPEGVPDRQGEDPGSPRQSKESKLLGPVSPISGKAGDTSPRPKPATPGGPPAAKGPGKGGKPKPKPGAPGASTRPKSAPPPGGGAGPPKGAVPKRPPGKFMPAPPKPGGPAPPKPGGVASPKVRPKSMPPPPAKKGAAPPKGAGKGFAPPPRVPPKAMPAAPGSPTSAGMPPLRHP